MFKNVNHEEHFSGAKSPPVSPTGHAMASLRQENQGSSWISLFSVVSRPALSLLQKVLPGRTPTPALSDSISGWTGEELADSGSAFLGQLDKIMPSTSHSTHHLAYVHCQHECDAGLVETGCARTLNWLTADSLSELGITDTAEINFNMQPQASVGYFATARSFLSQVVSNTASAHDMRHAEMGQIIGGETWSSAGTSQAKSNGNWWGGFWGSEDHSQSWLSNLSRSREVTGTSTQHSSDHCFQPEIGTKAAVAKPTEQFAQCHDVESMHGESAGPSCHKEELTDNGSLQTARPESLPSSQGLPLEHWPSTTVSSLLVNAGAVTSCSEVAVLTPDQDNGYSSLEEEHTTCRLYMVKAPCKELQGLTEMNGDSFSPASLISGEREPEEKYLEQREEGEVVAAGEMNGGEEGDQEEMKESDISDLDDEGEASQTSTQEGLPTSASPLATPICQNKAIAYIMGNPCSDDSQSDDSLSEEEDDDGFDSEGGSDFSDSEGLDDDDDSDVDESDSEQAEAERLWNSLCRSRDPYNPRNFTAPINTAATTPKTIPTSTLSASTCSPQASPLNQPPSPSPLSSSPASPPSPLPLLDSWDESSASEMDEAESLRLWNSFGASSDPYSPLNFQAPLRTQVPHQAPGPGGRGKKARTPPQARHAGPSSPPEAPQYKRSEAEERLDSGFSETLLITETTSVTVTAITTTSRRCVTLKKVRFCEQVEEFYASSGEEDRRGPWEELARDRCRFLRRVQEAEEAIGHVLAPAVRALAYRRLQDQHRQHS